MSLLIPPLVAYLTEALTEKVAEDGGREKVTLS